MEMKEKREHIFLPIYPGRSYPLHAMLVSCGRQDINDISYRWDGTKRGFKEMVIWQYTVSGRGNLRLDNQEYAIEPGQAMLLKVPENHLYYFKSENIHWELLFLTLNGSEMVRLWLELRKRLGSPVISHVPGSSSLELGRQIIDMSSRGELKNPFIASAKTYEFGMALLKEFYPTGKSGESPEFIGKVRDYCLRNISKDITIDKLAAIAGYSRYHFIRQFHKYQGISPMDFVMDLKMRFAVRLFQTEQLSVKEVADRCGFSSTSYFCKVFRKYHGITPAQFRDYQ